MTGRGQDFMKVLYYFKGIYGIYLGEVIVEILENHMNFLFLLLKVQFNMFT